VGDEISAFIQTSFDKASQFCRELGIEGDAVSEVLKAKDGAFFIQAASMIEAALNSGLSKRISISKGFGRLNDDEVLSIVERMQMGGANSKVEMALTCDLIHKSHKQYIEGMLDIRNLYVHRFQNYGMPFHDLFNGLIESKKKSLMSKLDPVRSCADAKESPHLFASILELNARVILVSLVAHIMRFREPQSLLTLLTPSP
jgi:hypothetical protein